MVSCKSKNGHHKGIRCSNIGLNAHNLLTSLSSIVNIVTGWTYVIFEENPHIDNYEENGYGSDLDLLILYQLSVELSRRKWA